MSLHWPAQRIKNNEHDNNETIKIHLKSTKLTGTNSAGVI